MGSYDVGGSPTWMSFDDTSMFVSDPTTGTIVRMDPISGEVLATTPVRGRPVDGDVAPDGTVWMPDLNGRLIHLATDGAVLDEWDLDISGPFVLVDLAGRIWVAEWKGIEVVRYDVD